LFQVGERYAVAVYMCGSAIFAVLSCFVADWVAWLKLIWSFNKFIEVLLIYTDIKAIKTTNQEFTDFIRDLPLPEKDNVWLLESCPICYVNMDRSDARVTPCGHVFHIECLSRWIKKRQICAVCQQPVKTQSNLSTTCP
jgi:Ring finger domain